MTTTMDVIRDEDDGTVTWSVDVTVRKGTRDYYAHGQWHPGDPPEARILGAIRTVQDEAGDIVSREPRAVVPTDVADEAIADALDEWTEVQGA